MRPPIPFLLAVALLCVTPRTAWPQDTGATGLAISVPTAIGVIWHASDRLALRPDVSFGFNETDGQDTVPDISSKNVTLGVSALFYTHRRGDVRTYASPRVTYSRATTSVSGIGGGDTTLSSWAIAGSFGGQYALGARFGVFAEAGLLYSNQRSASASTIVDRTTWTFGTRTTVGGILYF